MLTEESLKASKEYKDWISGRVAVIHNTYYDCKDLSPSFIVLHSSMGKWTITRFFEMGSRLLVSNDHVNISTEETFKLLLSQYSRGLD